MPFRHFRLAPQAVDDLLAILKRSIRKFGLRTAEQYSALIDLAIDDLVREPQRIGSRTRFDILGGLYLYHIKYSKRQQTKSGKRINRPRHVLAYRLPDDTQLHILRILHDRMKLERHKFPRHPTY